MYFRDMKKILSLLFCLPIAVVSAQTCTFFADSDGDAYGDPNNSIEADCSSILMGFVGNDLDCDDTNASINPDAMEICNYLDDNCNGGEIDEFVVINYYLDSDGDGYGDPNFVLYDCSLPSGYVENMDDCDDQLVTYVDADGDGFGSAIIEPCGVTNNLDCNDNTAAIQDSTIYYADLDQDGYGDPNNFLVSCDVPVGYIPDGTDCNDLDLDIHPGAPDAIGNGIDENCDGQDGVGIAVMNGMGVACLRSNMVQEMIHIQEMEIGSSWSLVHSSGQVVLTWRADENEKDISVSQFPRGLYLVIGEKNHLRCVLY